MALNVHFTKLIIIIVITTSILLVTNHFYYAFCGKILENEFSSSRQYLAYI